MSFFGNKSVNNGSGGSYTLPIATTSMLGGVKQGINTIISTDGTIASTPTDYYFGFENLKKYFNATTPNIVVYGDSIVDGTGSHGNDSWAEQLKNNAYLNFGFKGYGFQQKKSAPTNYTYAGWGIINLMLTNSIDVSLTYSLSDSTRTTSNKITLIYGTNTDGGTAILQDNIGTVLGNINCNGAKGIKTIDVTLGQFKSLVIIPTGKIYINGTISECVGYTGARVDTIAYGGHGLNMYSDADIQATADTFKTADLFIMEMGANDYNVITATEWKRRCEILISALRGYKVDVLIMVAESNHDQNLDPLFDTQWKQAKRDLAKQYNCAYIDIDKFWNGYTVGNTNGLYLDTIHPSQKGHDSIANLMNKLLFPQAHNYYNQEMVNNQDINKAQTFDGFTGEYTIDAISMYKQYIFRKKTYFKDIVTFTVGNVVGQGAVVSGGNTGQRPTKPVKYQEYYDTTVNRPIWCTTPAVVDGGGAVTTPAVWTDNLSRFIVTPPPSSSYAGQVGDWSCNSSYLYICTAPSTWSRVSIATW